MNVTVLLTSELKIRKIIVAPEILLFVFCTVKLADLIMIKYKLEGRTFASVGGGVEQDRKNHAFNKKYPIKTKYQYCCIGYEIIYYYLL